MLTRLCGSKYLMKLLVDCNRRPEQISLLMSPSKKIAEHPEVLQHLSPLQSVGAHKQDTSSTFSGGKGKGGNHGDGKGEPSKGKGKANTGIAVPDDCEIFVDGKQLCKRWQVGRCTAKIKPGKRCMVGYHMCWKKSCHKLHPGNECPH